MPDPPLKLLAAGDIRGRWGPFLKRVEAVNKKAGPFELVLVSGSAFGSEEGPDETWNEILSGSVRVPLPVYILGPNSERENEHFESPSGCELAENVIYLGKSGLYTTNEGLSIAYLSGTEASNAQYTLTEKELQQLEQKVGWDEPGFKGVDILLTSEWPRGITSGAPSIQGIYSEETGSKIISLAALRSSPRYHFAGLQGKHYERPPYRNHRVLSEKSKHVTRFVSLAPVGNADKAKWLYAFNISPLKKLSNEELTKQPDYATEVPFKASHLSIEKEGSSSSFFFDMDVAKNMGRKRGGKGHDQRNSKTPRKDAGVLKDSCWFCLSGSEVEKHLVVSVGDHSYLALPKGGLVSDHVLVLPIAHHASSLDLPPEVGEEIQRFKGALKKYFASEGKCVVFYERFFRCYHMQLQVVPLPLELSDKAVESFLNAKDVCGVELLPIPPTASLAQMVEGGRPFFYMETSAGQRLFHGIRSGFNLNFGRDVLGSPSLLDLPDRIDWRSCKLELEEETQLTKTFREAFAKYDFTLEDDENEGDD